MASNGSNSPNTITGPWIIGIGLIILGFLTMLLFLRWFELFEVLALAGGLAAMGGLFAFYAWTHPGQNWAGWASYILCNMAFFFGVGFFLDFQLRHYVAWAAFLIGVTFIVIYVRQVWLNRRKGYWWAAVVAGVMVTTAASVVQLRLGWPPHLLTGILIFTFMGGVSFTMFLLWIPNMEDANFRWLTGPMIITALIAILGALITMDMLILAPPFLLMALGAIYLVRFLVLQWRQEEPAPEPAPNNAGLPPAQTRITALPPQSGIQSTQPVQPQITASTAPAIALPDQTLTREERITPPDTIQLSSPAFAPGSSIPLPHTCDGTNTSPPLQWQHVPPGAESLVLICDSPDAPGGILTYWVLYNLPAQTGALKADIAASDNMPEGAMHGINDFGRAGYDGPCPPPGEQNHYIFKLYALDGYLPLSPGASKRDVISAMQGHIIAIGQLSGTYQRRPPVPA